jgi:predicted porin
MEAFDDDDFIENLIADAEADFSADPTTANLYALIEAQEVAEAFEKVDDLIQKVRNMWDSNFNKDKDVDKDNRYWDQRLRIKLTGMVGNGIEVRTRLNVGNDTWDGKGASKDNSVNLDYGYLHIPVQGIVIDAGRMTRNVGNKLLLWDKEFNTFQITTNLGDTQIGLYTDKVDDTFDGVTGEDNLDDKDNYGLFANYSAGNMNAGIHLIFEQDNTNTDGRDGSQASVYLNTSVGAIGINAEVAYKGGDLNENDWCLEGLFAELDGESHECDGDAGTAAFINVSTDLGAMSVNAALAIAMDGFKADNDFAPTVFLGTAHPTALADFTALDDSTTWAAVVGASTDVSADMSVSAKAMYIDLENFGDDEDDASATEIDLGLSYKLANNATYYVDLGYWIPDNLSEDDDDAIAIAHKVQVFF